MSSEPTPPAPVIIDESGPVSKEAWDADLPKMNPEPTPPAPTTHPDAVVAGASAMYEALPEFYQHEDGYYYWPDLSGQDRQDYCRAFAAGLEAMWQPIETLPPFDQRPQRMFIRVEGWKEHSGSLWKREWRDSAFICREDQPNSYLGYRRTDMERMMRDGDMDGIDRVTHWQPLPEPPRTTGDAA